MPTNELEMFLAAWDREAASTREALKALPSTQIRVPRGPRRPIR